MTIYIDIVMSIIEEVSWMSKSGYSNRELLEYIDKHYDEIECDLSGEVYKEPKKCDHNFCIKCKLRKIVDYERLTLVCTNCGLCEYYPVYVASSSNHMMQYLRRKCIYKRSDNFKVISSFMVERSLFQMMLWKQLGMKYMMELIYCTTTPYQ